MRNFISLTVLALLFVMVGCSTRASFKIPEGSNLIVDGKTLSSVEVLDYKRSPFFWDKASGIPYIIEKNGKVTDEGNIKSHFRVASIFWPPFSIIYWPIRFDGPYDFTQPNSKIRPIKK